VLSAQLVAQGSAANLPVGINVTGTGATLANSSTAINITTPTVTNAPVVVTVTSAAGTGATPTGNVTVTASGTGFTPIVTTEPLVNGTVTINETAVPAGTVKFTANYIGDRVYGPSTASTSVKLAPGAVTLMQPAAASVPTYVLSGGQGSAEPYDGSQIPFYYNYPVTVLAANGAPLLGTPILNAAGTQIGTDYGNVTYEISGGTPVCNGSAATSVPMAQRHLAPTALRSTRATTRFRTCSRVTPSPRCMAEIPTRTMRPPRGRRLPSSRYGIRWC
jgi:hypothetical protein